MDEAKQQGYSNEYIFIHYYWMSGLKNPLELWNGPSDGHWENLLLMSIKLPPAQAYMDFIKKSVNFVKHHLPRFPKIFTNYNILFCCCCQAIFR